jgi:hypothetical protein
LKAREDLPDGRLYINDWNEIGEMREKPDFSHDIISKINQNCGGVQSGLLLSEHTFDDMVVEGPI